MAQKRIHLSPQGPSDCGATVGNCPYAEDGHFLSLSGAESAFEEKMGGAVPAPTKRTLGDLFRKRKSEPAHGSSEPRSLDLQLDFGSATVRDGDLSDSQTRHYLVNGLCGDLAMAIHEKQGGRVFFAVDEQLPPGVTLESAAQKGELGDHVAHAFVESREHPGTFLDAYGVKSAKDIEDYYGTSIREVAPEILSHYGSGPRGARGTHDLSAFADAAITLDREGRFYDYEGED